MSPIPDTLLRSRPNYISSDLFASLLFEDSTRRNTNGECFDLAQRLLWNRLPTMEEERGQFNPCVCQGLIYLPGGLSTSRIEVFNPDLWLFFSLKVTLPEVAGTVAWVTDGQLTVVSPNYVTKLKLGKSDATVKKHKCRLLYPVHNPVVDRDCVYWVDAENKVSGARIDSGPIKIHAIG